MPFRSQSMILYWTLGRQSLVGLTAGYIHKVTGLNLCAYHGDIVLIIKDSHFHIFSQDWVNSFFNGTDWKKIIFWVQKMKIVWKINPESFTVNYNCERDCVFNQDSQFWIVSYSDERKLNFIIFIERRAVIGHMRISGRVKIESCVYSWLYIDSQCNFHWLDWIRYSFAKHIFFLQVLFLRKWLPFRRSFVSMK